jgi:hypothetical protein
MSSGAQLQWLMIVQATHYTYMLFPSTPSHSLSFAIQMHPSCMLYTSGLPGCRSMRMQLNLIHDMRRYLDPDYRRPLILMELLGFHADIICLQEMDEKAFAEYFLPQMQQAGRS